MEIGYSSRRKEMFHTQTDNVFGICQLGEWDTFNHNNVQSYNKRIIDFSKPFPLWLPVLQELSNLFIVSKFTAPEDITNALDLIRLCRNHLVFITVLTPSINKTRKDLVEIKTNSDIFLSVENQYCENEVFTDPVSYAIDFLAHAFDEYIDKNPVFMLRFICTKNPIYTYQISKYYYCQKVYFLTVIYFLIFFRNLCSRSLR